MCNNNCYPSCGRNMDSWWIIIVIIVIFVVCCNNGSFFGTGGCGCGCCD